MTNRRKTQSKERGTGKERLYTLEVALLSGPVSASFVRGNAKVSRTIQIRGDQSLDALHLAIFMAFNRFDEHMYEFQFGNRPGAPDNISYTCSTPVDAYEGGGVDSPEVGGTSTRVGSLGLRAKQIFFYWFDFGDDWWHKIKVVEIQDDFPEGHYPIVTKRVGASPPQYQSWDE